jgi:predicted nuclease of predicted toxin-antitoxin system
VRFLLDEDVTPKAAEAAWKMGLDVTSVHDLGRRGLSDYEQLRRAASDRRIFVTRNREDYVRWTAECFRTREPHPGLLILPPGISNDRPDAIASALKRWAYARAETTFGPYHAEFLVR